MYKVYKTLGGRGLKRYTLNFKVYKKYKKRIKKKWRTK